MSNLIEKDDLGNWSIKGLPWRNLYVGQVITRETHEILYGCLWKLMEYEDTNLSPELIENLFDLDEMIAFLDDNFIIKDKWEHAFCKTCKEEHDDCICEFLGNCEFGSKEVIRYFLEYEVYKDDKVVD